MKLRLKSMAFGVLFLSALATGCKKDKDEPEENDEEVITTMKLTFTPVGGGTPLTYQFRDADGPGGAAPTQDEIALATSKTYNVAVQLLNEAANPVEDVTVEVMEEAAAHRFYYQPSAGSNITVDGLNSDGDGVALGTTSTWTTGAAANGSIRIILRHYPGNPPGKAAADAVNSDKSDTDIEVSFTTKVN